MSERLSIHVVDGLAHRVVSGYGVSARFIILGLVDLGHDVRLITGERDWGPIPPGERERLETLERTASPDFADVVLHIGLPSARRRSPKPSLLYTMNALGEIRPEWVQAMRVWDAIVVPSEFDRAVFARHFGRVYVAPLGSDPVTFKPVPVWRAEGSQLFTFLFVGTYHFRKGVDLLLEAFLSEFAADEPVELLLQAPGAGLHEEFTHCLALIRRYNPWGRVRLRGNTLAPGWMNRLYNQCDCVITLSRGEGWCMPLSEALLCRVPVIAPDSTAMAEYLDESVAELVPVREVAAADAPAPFGSSVSAAYGFPGITYYEPDLGAARAAMRRVYDAYPEAVTKAGAGRERMLTRYSRANTARQVERACTAVLRDQGSVAGRPPYVA